MDYEQSKRFWHSLSSERLERAAEFYEKSPDGQYDDFAAECIRFLLHQLQARQ